MMTKAYADFPSVCYSDPDPKDDKFLELAVNGHADMIVSGDSDLLALNPFRDIPIVPPAIFIRAVTG
jgi:predicted nucleic acid-binding protein